MPHFHIPLQSGSDEILKKMKRRYLTALYTSRVNKIREILPDAAIGVDVIVGSQVRPRKSSWKLITFSGVANQLPACIYIF